MSGDREWVPVGLAGGWIQFSLPQGCLALAGLILLADLDILARRTILQGNASWMDGLIISAGMQRHSNPALVSNGEYPITANMTSGYIFRVENEATVYFLQQIGEPGSLTTVDVNQVSHSTHSILRAFGFSGSIYVVVLNLCCIQSMALLLFCCYAPSSDFWACGVILGLILARLLTIAAIKSRHEVKWHGAKEPGQRGDLLVLLSRDRWIRMVGLVDDLESVTSGQWLRDESLRERVLNGSATLILYLCAALVYNMSESDQITIVLLVVMNSAYIALGNSFIMSLQMKGRIVKYKSRKPYLRRLDMAEELTRESGRKDWALRLGLIKSDDTHSSKEEHAPVQIDL